MHDKQYYVKNYHEFVAALAKPGVDQHRHACLGMLSEVGELAGDIKKHEFYEVPLDRENAIKELGDIRFFLQMEMNDLGIKASGKLLDGLFYDYSESPLFILPSIVSYSMHPDHGDRRENYAYNMHTAFLELCKMFEVDEETVIEKNIEKLMKRYPSMTYSNEDALARRDEQA